MKHILDDSRSSHFWSTFWSPIDACYIPFQSSGSQQSNASNGAQFGVETKKLQPLQANHSKLKEAFCKVLRNHPFVAKWFRSLFVQCGGFSPEVARYMRQVGSWEPQGGSQLRSPARIACCCEVISQPSWASAKSRRHHFLLRNGSWSIPIFSTDIGRYFTSDFCCLNPKILLVSLQLQDSLVFKLVKRENIYVIISFVLCSYIYPSRACSQRGDPL